MKDNKIYKILRIIFLTLAIFSLVFTLAKKVGLCASSNPTEGLTFDSTLPLPVGVGYGYDSSVVVFDEDFVTGARSYCNSNLPYSSTPDISVIYFSESYYDTDGYFLLRAVSQDGATRPLSFTVYMSGSVPATFVCSNTYEFRFRWYPDTNTFSNFSYIGYRQWSCYYFGSSNYPFGSAPLAGKYVFNKDTFYAGYPLWVDRYDYMDSSGTYTMFQYISQNTGVNFEEGEVTSLPSFDSLTGTPDSNDTSVTLFDKLKGWLSTISGNIQKGFKNIEDNLKSFFKPYLDNAKNFFEWVVAEPDGDAIKDAFMNTDLMTSVEDSKTAITGLYGMFSTPTSVCPSFTIPINATGGVFHNMPDIVISFAWYENIRSIVTPVIVVFVTLTCVFSVINSIPDIFHGKSGERNVNT